MGENLPVMSALELSKLLLVSLDLRRRLPKLLLALMVMVSVAPALTQPPVRLPLMPPCPMSCQSLLVFFLKALLDIAVSFQALEPVVKPLQTDYTHLILYTSLH